MRFAAAADGAAANGAAANGDANGAAANHAAANGDANGGAKNGADGAAAAGEAGRWLADVKRQLFESRAFGKLLRAFTTIDMLGYAGEVRRMRPGEDPRGGAGREARHRGAGGWQMLRGRLQVPPPPPHTRAHTHAHKSTHTHTHAHAHAHAHTQSTPGLDYSVAHYGVITRDPRLDCVLTFVDDREEADAADWGVGEVGAARADTHGRAQSRVHAHTDARVCTRART